MNKITHASPLDLYEVKSGATIHPGALVALDGDGKAVPAADTAGITVIGVAARIFDGCCEVESGIVALAGHDHHPAQGGAQFHFPPDLPGGISAGFRHHLLPGNALCHGAAFQFPHGGCGNDLHNAAPVSEIMSVPVREPCAGKRTLPLPAFKLSTATHCAAGSGTVSAGAG